MPKKLSSSKIMAGCQAWGYDVWKTLRSGPTVFFPHNIRDNEKLSFYAKVFDTVEADGSFYAIPKESDLENWYARVPEHFKFSLKLPREVTHVHALSSASFPVVEEFLKRLEALKTKTGAILIQLPVAFKMTRGMRENVENFLKFLPDTHRFAIEFRAEEWFCPEIFELADKHKVAFCLGQNEFLPREIMIKALEFPSVTDGAAGFMYFRFSGARDLTKTDRIQRPQEESLQFWAEQIGRVQGKDVYVYFSNLFEGLSPASAISFRKMLGQKFLTPDELNLAPSLF